MRTIKGKQTHPMDAADVAAWAANFQYVTIDLGAGDGRFVRHLALRRPAAGAIGVDLCADNLRATSRTAPDNALFVVGDALALPGELSGIATWVTINFPWGSLLRGLLAGDPGLLAGLRAISRSAATLEIRLNAGALAEAGWTLDAGSAALALALHDAGFGIETSSALGAAELRRWPTTWAKRLACGRDPRGWQIEASLRRPLARRGRHDVGFDRCGSIVAPAPPAPTRQDQDAARTRSRRACYDAGRLTMNRAMVQPGENDGEGGCWTGNDSTA